MIVHDANQPSMLPYTMSKARKLPLNSLNDFLTCKLCRGYYIDATTIIECLHSFCRSCIVKYLETNKYCPICDVQVHKTKPLINIRQDKILQSIVYKLVPRLFQNEMLRRKGFYSSHPEEKKNLDVEELGEAHYQHILAPDETVCVALNYKDSSVTPRYLQCSAALSICHLQKLIRSKYDLSCKHRIDIFHEEDVLNSYLTLIDVAYSALWRRKGPLALTYRIYESTLAPANNKQKSLSSVDNINSNNNNNIASNDWKEVQIQISENGEMSVTGIQDCLQLLDNMDDHTKSLDKPVKTGSNKKDSCINAEDRLDLKPLKNNSKITKVELNQPPTQSNTSDVIILDTPLLPAVTLTVAELKELSKIEEAAKTQASDALPLPPPAKKSKKELPDLKLIGPNKNQKKNGAKVTNPPQEPVKTVTDTSITIAQLTSKPANCKNVTVTSVTVIPACSTTEQQSTASTTNSTTVMTSTQVPSTPVVVKSSMTDTIVVVKPPVLSSNNNIAVSTSSTCNTHSNAAVIASSTAVTTNSDVSTPNMTVTMTNTTVPISNVNVETCSGKSINDTYKTSVTTSAITKPVVTSAIAALNSSNVNVTMATVPVSVSTVTSKRKHSATSSSMTDIVPAQKLPKPTILNHSLGLQKTLNLSKNHPLTTKHQKAAEIASKVAASSPNLLNTSNASNQWTPSGVALKSYGTLINVPKGPINQINKPQAVTPPSSISTTTVATATAAILDSKHSHKDSDALVIKSKASTPIGYKTLKDPPKTWNPTVHYHKVGGVGGVGAPVAGAKAGDLKNVRPAKFFKMRNNMPRYLGCPNSGVKPMFQVHVSPEKEKPTVSENICITQPQLTSVPNTNITSVATTTTTTTAPSIITNAQTPQITVAPALPQSKEHQIRKHSIVKIDPKTLKPISEKAPESSSLSTTTKCLIPNKPSIVIDKTDLQLLKGDNPSVHKSQGRQVLDDPQQYGAVHNKGRYDFKNTEKVTAKTTSLHQTDQSTSRPHQQTSSPIVSTTPTTSTPSLNLRINTTSVSITNPLRKSPHSPKKSTSPPNLNHHTGPKSIKTPPPCATSQLNYTPSNPFIPNPLASPTLNPNQFNLLTAAVAAAQGFHHGYDPRYHHHLPYHHQLYPPRLPPFAPPQVGNWWAPPPASAMGVGQQQRDAVPLSGNSASRSSPRGLIWNGPTTDNTICSPKEAKTATSASIDSKTSLDILVPRSSSSRKDANSLSNTNHKGIANIIDSVHDDGKTKETAKTVLPKGKALSDFEDKSKIVQIEKANDSDKGPICANETQSEKIVQKSTSSDTPKENAVLAVT